MQGWDYLNLKYRCISGADFLVGLLFVFGTECGRGCSEYARESLAEVACIGKTASMCDLGYGKICL